MPQLSRWQNLQITAKHRREWYTAMTRTLGDGKSLFVILERLGGEYNRTKHPLGPLIRELMARLSGAGSASRGGARQTVGSDLLGLVPTIEANLIDAGEASGDLAIGFQRAAEHLGKMQALRAEIMGPLKQPVILVAFILGVLVFFSYQILPSFDSIAPRARWPGYSQNYGALADHAIAVSLGLVGVLAGAALWFARAAANWTGVNRARADRYVFPFTLLAQVNTAALLTSLAGFVGAGVKFDVALNQLASSSNRYMKTIYGHLKGSMRDAAKPEDALCALHIVDRSYHWLIKIYGDSSDFAGAMRRISEEVIERSILRARATFAIVNVFLLIAVAAFIVWTLGSLYGIVMTVRRDSQFTVQASPADLQRSPASAVLTVGFVFEPKPAAQGTRRAADTCADHGTPALSPRALTVRGPTPSRSFPPTGVI